MLAFGTDQFGAPGQGKLSVDKLQASKLGRQATFGTEKNIDKIMQKINSRQTMNSQDIGERSSANVFSKRNQSESKQKGLILDDGIFDIAPPESENSKGLDRRLTSKFCIPFENSQVSNNHRVNQSLVPDFPDNKIRANYFQKESFGNSYFSRRSRVGSNQKSLSKNLTFGGVEISTHPRPLCGFEELSTFRTSNLFPN